MLTPTRRTALKVGGLGAFSLPTLLELQARAGTKTAARAKSVVLVYLGGGLSHHDSFDPKPDAPDDIRGKYKPLATKTPGVVFSEKLPKLAALQNTFATFRGGAHNNDHHETATNWVLSGRFGTPFGDYPAVGAVASYAFGFTGAVPPYVSVPRNPSFTWELGRSAFLGGRYESFRAGDPNQKNYRVEDVSPPAGVDAKAVARRQTLLKTVDQLAKDVDGNDQVATYDEFAARARQMVLSPAARKAFAIEDEKDAVRDRFGRTTFGQSALLSRRLVEAGVRFVTINYGGWDHHGKIFEGLDKKLPELDQGLSAMFEDFTARGLDKDTLIVVLGEFGRSPKINKDAGRDHWGPAASLLFFGAGVKPGFVLGKTDKHGGYVAQRPAGPADIAYTVLDSLGIDPHMELKTPDGRPLAVLDGGEPVRELFA